MSNSRDNKGDLENVPLEIIRFIISFLKNDDKNTMKQVNNYFNNLIKPNNYDSVEEIDKRINKLDTKKFYLELEMEMFKRLIDVMYEEALNNKIKSFTPDEIIKRFESEQLIKIKTDEHKKVNTFFVRNISEQCSSLNIDAKKSDTKIENSTMSHFTKKIKGVFSKSKKGNELTKEESKEMIRQLNTLIKNFQDKSIEEIDSLKNKFLEQKKNLTETKKIK